MHRQDRRTGRVSSRKANTPLPAVPTDAHSRCDGRMLASHSASCNDLLSSFSTDSASDRFQRARLARAASTDFDLRDWQRVPLLPLSPGEDADRLTMKTMPVPQANPLHDYEELSDRYKEIGRESRHPSDNLHGMAGNQPRCVSASSAGSPTNPTAKGSISRDRQNPMYSGTGAISPFSTTFSDTASMKGKDGARISEKCACILLVGFIVAIVLSVLSFALVLSLYLGVTHPAVTDTRNDINGLQDDFVALGENMESNVQEIKALQQQLNQTGGGDFVLQNELKNLIESLNDTQLQQIFGRLSGIASSRCQYQTHAIKSSVSLDLVESGQYLADPGFVITGVSCSVPFGYSGELQAIPTIRNNMGYRCICRKNVNVTLVATERVECRIHLWMCPLV